MCKCTRIQDILKAEKSVILRHLDDHKWYNSIEDENSAIMDFVWKYAWLMREVFCGSVCSEKDCCEASKSIRESFLHDVSDGELNEFIRKYNNTDLPRELSYIELQVIKTHIGFHKWFRGIESYEDAVRDFLFNFGWLIKEVFDQKS